MSALPRSKVPQRSRRRAAGQPVVLRRPPIHLIQLSARSFAMGGLIYRSGLGRRVEGRSPCRGQVPCRRQVAVSRAGSVSRVGRRVEATGQPQFSKKLADLCLYIYWPNQNERSEEKAGDGSVANRSSAALPPPALKHGGARVGARRR